MPERVRRVLAWSQATCAALCAVTLASGAGALADARFAALGTIACALTTLVSLYAAYEGFDTVLRRPRERR